MVAAWLVLAASSSALAWQVSLHGSGSGYGEAKVAVGAPDGDVIVGGYLDQASGPAFAVVRLAGGDGGERWRAVLPGVEPGPFFPRDGAVTVAAIGSTHERVAQLTRCRRHRKTSVCR